MAGAVGFPVLAFGQVTTGAPRRGQGPPIAATNGYLSSLLPPEQRAELRTINVRLTQLAIQQCSGDVGVANQILFDTLFCEFLLAFAAHDVSPADLLRLSRDFDVVFPWSLAYGNVRTTFNARFFRLPLAVVFPRTVEQVAFWVKFVRDHELSVSIRSGNNCYESFSIDNDIVIDVTFLTLRRSQNGEQFRLDLKAGVVHVAAGVRLGVLYTELAKRGVTMAAGQCSPVCLGGLVGTGGVGFSTRAFGYVCDQLEEVEYVLADGSVVVANARNAHADLFRATKGAGAAGLGVITRLTMRVVPAVTILLYTVTFDLEDAASVLEKWQNLATRAPDALSSVANIGAAASPSDGGAFFINGQFRVDHGTVPAAKDTLARILRTHWLDLLPAPLNRAAIQIEVVTALEAATRLALEAPQPIFNHWKLKSNFVFRRLTAAALQPLVDFLLTHAPSDDQTEAIGALTILLMGGMANRIDPNSAVVPARQGTVTWFHGGALWTEQALEAPSLAFVDELFDVLNPILQSQTAQYGAPDRQLGSQLAPEPDLRYVSAYWSGPRADFVPFLTGVKQRYDPLDVFQFAQSIPLDIPLRTRTPRRRRSR